MTETTGLWEEGRVRQAGAGMGRGGPNQEGDAAILAAAIDHWRVRAWTVSAMGLAVCVQGWLWV